MMRLLIHNLFAKGSKFESRQSVSRSSGFTLMELITVVIIMGVIIAQIYSILDNTYKTGQKIEDILAGTELVPSIMILLSNDLRNSYKNNSTQQFFMGDESNLKFYTFYPSFTFDDINKTIEIKRGGQVSYYMEDNKKKPGFKVLYRRTTYESKDNPQLNIDDIEIITERIKSLKFNYVEYSEDKSNIGTEWKSDQNGGKLPTAMIVKLEIEMYESSKKDESRVVNFDFKIPLL